MHSEGPDREREQRHAPLAVDGERDREGRGDRRPGDDPGRIGAGAERGPHGDPAGHDHRRDRAGDPDADPDPERGEQDQGHVGRDAARGPEPGDQRDARRERQPRSEPRRQSRAERREQPHAQDRDGRQEPGRRGREAEVAADQRQQRPDREDLLAERQRGDEQAHDDRDGDTRRGGRHAPDAIGRWRGRAWRSPRAIRPVRSRHVKGRVIVRRLGPRWRAAAGATRWRQSYSATCRWFGACVALPATNTRPLTR